MKKVQIKLEKPCSQPWDLLPKVSGGLYCGQCAKVVKDFSGMSDEELIAVLTQKRSGSVCGRFTPEQLNKTYHYKPDSGNNNMSFWKILMAGLLTFKLPLHSQTTSVKDKSEKVQNEANKAQAPVLTTSQVIKGKVSDRYTKQGLPVKISIYFNYIGGVELLSTYSDNNGYYEIELAPENLANFFRIEYTRKDYTERNIVVDKHKLPKLLNVTLTAAPVNSVSSQMHDLTLDERKAQEIAKKARLNEEIARMKAEIESQRSHTGGILLMKEISISDTIRRKIEQLRNSKKSD
ncbi:MAG: hypothetical protein IT236_03195 [Bacteroidia bacterium]|nr:hypothetical protein [Bacteroidia bacterium]